MSDAILALVPVYGLPLLAAVASLSCLGLPLPASLVMMLMGSFAAAGDFGLVPVFVTAFAAAVGGDQIGYFVGRFAGQAVTTRIARKPAGKAALDRATQEIARHATIGIFLTRWLFSPLGPYMNLVTGATGFSWAHFTAAGVAGEAVWVILHVGLGILFSDNVLAIAEIVGDASGFLAAGIVALLLGWRLVTVLGRGKSGRA
ncbi:DedA family protein [Ciceribacter sp. RN22]|uniref:DedA family protein n=1 Tax=Ciceribacter sp. RN22 TaxID=2954932 RepID=UPI002093DD0D|nr:VTT domain-containing protein [Ciceribacter sp. RN22]MCO6179272.1 VTT domain-containing protein [Ciceribacter sp. RN22]